MEYQQYGGSHCLRHNEVIVTVCILLTKFTLNRELFKYR